MGWDKNLPCRPDGGWVTILLDNVTFKVKEVNEKDSLRTKYNGKKELLLSWITTPHYLKQQ
jgi:hypothetical protein